MSEQASSGSQPGEICPPASPFQGYIGNIMRHFHLSYHGGTNGIPWREAGVLSNNLHRTVVPTSQQRVCSTQNVKSVEVEKSCKVIS